MGLVACVLDRITVRFRIRYKICKSAQRLFLKVLTYSMSANIPIIVLTPARTIRNKATSTPYVR